MESLVSQIQQGSPLTVLAVFLGGKLHTHIPRARFERFVYVFLVLIGVFLVV